MAIPKKLSDMTDDELTQVMAQLEQDRARINEQKRALSEEIQIRSVRREAERELKNMTPEKRAQMKLVLSTAE